MLKKMKSMQNQNNTLVYRGKCDSVFEKNLNHTECHQNIECPYCYLQWQPLFILFIMCQNICIKREIKTTQQSNKMMKNRDKTLNYVKTLKTSILSKH